MLWLEVARSLVMLAFSRCSGPAAAQNARIRAVLVLTNPEPKAAQNGGYVRSGRCPTTRRLRDDRRIRLYGYARPIWRPDIRYCR
jgi:hypothetical protein